MSLRRCVQWKQFSMREVLILPHELIEILLGTKVKSEVVTIKELEEVSPLLLQKRQKDSFGSNYQA